MATSEDRHWTASRWLILAAIVITSLNLRPAVVSVSPVLEVIRADLALSYTLVSLLTMVPIFCMGVFAFGTPFVTKHIGRERGVLWAVVLIGGATGLRLWGKEAVILFGTTILVGIGIAIAQTILPSLVKSHFQDRVALATGLYSGCIALGAALASGLTVPVMDSFDSWPIALAIWSLLAIVASVMWLPVLRSNETEPTPDTQPERSSPATGIPWRNGLAWAITLVFVLNVAVYYSLITWLAPRYNSLGWTENQAGLLLTVFIFTGLIGMFALTALGDRYEDRRFWSVVMLVPALIGTIGIAFLPELVPWIWAMFVGFGAGGWFTLALMLPVDYSQNEATADRLSSMALGLGYMAGAIVPFVIGGLRDVVGNFTIAFVGLAVLTFVGLAIGLIFSPRLEPVSA